MRNLKTSSYLPHKKLRAMHLTIVSTYLKHCTDQWYWIMDKRVRRGEDEDRQKHKKNGEEIEKTKEAGACCGWMVGKNAGPNRESYTKVAQLLLVPSFPLWPLPLSHTQKAAENRNRDHGRPTLFLCCHYPTAPSPRLSCPHKIVYPTSNIPPSPHITKQSPFLLNNQLIWSLIPSCSPLKCHTCKLTMILVARQPVVSLAFRVD